jgi:hypothetical protein
VEAAKAIRSGLGEPRAGAAGASVTAEDLAGGGCVLLLEASELHVHRLLLRARELRDELDAAGIVDRERGIPHERSIRRVCRANGPSRNIVDPDLESGAYRDDP